MKSDILLSVCIATYNRSKELKELIDSVLVMKRQDFEVVVTDNLSTDNTFEMLQSIQDARLRVCQNAKALPGLCNMIEAIFNANGKYAFYCNDRDLLYADEIERLIAFLRTDEFSFVQTSQRMAARRAKCSNVVRIYSKGYESLMHQALTHHPTGMVFNCEILRSYLNKQKYFQYLPVTYTYSFLMRDLLQYEKSAVYDYGCWAQRHPKYLKRNLSKTESTWYLPSSRTFNMKETMTQVFNNCRFDFSKEEAMNLAIYILYGFAEKIWSYKIFMMDEYLPAHHGIKKRFISTPKMLKISAQYYKDCIIFLKKNKYPQSFMDEWKGYFSKYYLKTIQKSLRADLVIIKRSIWAFKDRLFKKSRSDIS